MKKSQLTTSSIRMRLLVMAFALAAYTNACNSTPNSTSAIMLEVPYEVPPVVLLRPVPAHLAEHGPITVESNLSTIEKSIEISGSQFVNAKRGWVFTDRYLFTTSDSAKNWRRLSVDLPDNSRLSSLFFIDESRGWLARNIRLLVEPYAVGNSATILVTLDGGKSWTEQATFSDGVEVKQLKFLDASHGFAVGSRVKKHKPPYDQLFVAKTTDGGRNWTDISQKLMPAVDNAAAGVGRDIYWLSPSDILLLMSGDGRLVATSDGGESWKTLTRFQDERPDGTISSVSYYKLLTDPQNRIRIIAGAMGDEGYWGDLVMRSDQDTWNSYELRGIPIFDAIHLSENEILASGMEFRSAEDEKPPSPFGVIIYSSDLGKSWVPVYRSVTKEAFIGITRIGSNQFYAVSDAGTVLKFTLNNTKP